MTLLTARLELFQENLALLLDLLLDVIDVPPGAAAIGFQLCNALGGFLLRGDSLGKVRLTPGCTNLSPKGIKLLLRGEDLVVRPLVHLHPHLAEPRVASFARSRKRGVSQTLSIGIESRDNVDGEILSLGADDRSCDIQQAGSPFLVEIFAVIQDGGQEKEFFARVAVECELLQPEPTRLTGERLKHADFSLVVGNGESHGRDREGCGLGLSQKPLT
jgi:hypothetical protein